jgi:RimJ/RimL family protein N-acetyltransferase
MILAEHVGIGPILPTDLPHLLAWSDDPNLVRFSEPYLPKNMNREADFWLNTAGDSSRIFFAIRARSSAEIIGYLQVTAIQAIHRSAVLGILIAKPENRGRGFGREAMQLVIDYCWRHLNLTRLSLAVLPSNTSAMALYRRLGFETEGRLRKALFLDGQWTDLQWMALMQPDR